MGSSSPSSSAPTASPSAAAPLHETPSDEAAAKEIEESSTEGRIKDGVEEEVEREVGDLHCVEDGLKSTSAVGNAKERQHLSR